MSPESDQSSAGKSRHIYYASGDSGAALLQQMLGIFRAVTTRLVELQVRPSIPTDVVVVRVNDLVEALQLAIDRFLTEVETDTQRAARLLSKAMQVFMTLSDEDIQARVRWAREKLADVDLPLP